METNSWGSSDFPAFLIHYSMTSALNETISTTTIQSFLKNKESSWLFHSQIARKEKSNPLDLIDWLKDGSLSVNSPDVMASFSPL